MPRQISTQSITEVSRVCGLCPSLGPLVDSHIFPKWMGKAIRDDGPLLSIPTHKKSQPKFVHRYGEYDQIVCDPCEQSFGRVDDYFAEFSRARDRTRLLSKGDAAAHIYSGWNQALIQRFFLTCLFRAHLSSRIGYSSVDLGPHAERLKAELSSQSPTLVPDFEVTLLRETHVLSDAIVVPIRIRMGGANMYRMSVPGFGVLIRVDKRPASRTFTTFALGGLPDIYAVELDEVHPDLMGAMANAELLHGERINRMITPRLKPR